MKETGAQRKSFRPLSWLRTLGERGSISLINHPKLFILVVLIILNLLFFVVSAAIIQHLISGPAGSTSFPVCFYYALTMVLDAGCITNVVEDIGVAGTALVVTCVIIVMLGMITFTGGVIGYITTFISGVIENSNSGNWPLFVSGHTVLLNWNTRASEIINDLLYSDRRETVVVLSNRDSDELRAEVEERLYDTIRTENQELLEEIRDLPLLRRIWRYRRGRFTKKQVSVIFREGDAYSSKLLSEISVNKAKAIVILGADETNEVCQYGARERAVANEGGNSNLVKTTIQVAEITGAADSAENQQIIVEVEDPWTRTLIDKIIEHKKIKQKNNIVPISADRLLGQLLSQFSVMPELSDIYGELFSNKGAAFFSRNVNEIQDARKGFEADRSSGESNFVDQFLEDHFRAIPLTCMKDNEDNDMMYFVADSNAAVDVQEEGRTVEDLDLALSDHYLFPRRNIIILGHNSKSDAILEGFTSFRSEWNYEEPDQTGSREVLNITVIDDEASLKGKLYEDKERYPYIREVLPLDIYNREAILSNIRRIVRENGDNGNTSILILSDDNVRTEDIDSAALTYLIYVQEAIRDYGRDNTTGVDPSKIDVIVEIQNPKNHDVVQSYSASNIVISNRFISKMVTQISEKKTIFDLFSDILIYDERAAGNDPTQPARRYESMELYIKPVDRFFRKIPGECTAAQLIRAVHRAGPPENKSVVLGYVPYDKEKRRCVRPVLFSGNQLTTRVKLSEQDKIIVFSNH